jgi:hypothetical protein
MEKCVMKKRDILIFGFSALVLAVGSAAGNARTKKTTAVLASASLADFRGGDPDLDPIVTKLGFDFEKAVVWAGKGDVKSLGNLIRLASRTDAGAAEMMPDLLGDLLVRVGDKKFAMALAREPRMVRERAWDFLLEYSTLYFKRQRMAVYYPRTAAAAKKAPRR